MPHVYCIFFYLPSTSLSILLTIRKSEKYILHTALLNIFKKENISTLLQASLSELVLYNMIRDNIIHRIDITITIIKERPLVLINITCMYIHYVEIENQL